MCVCVCVCVYSLQVPIQRIGAVQRFAKSVQQGGVRLEDDDVVDHHGDQHHHHLQLVVDPQEHGARHQAQDAAVDEVLETDGEEREETW